MRLRAETELRKRARGEGKGKVALNLLTMGVCQRLACAGASVPVPAARTVVDHKTLLQVMQLVGKGCSKRPGGMITMSKGRGARV